VCLLDAACQQVDIPLPTLAFNDRYCRGCLRQYYHLVDRQAGRCAYMPTYEHAVHNATRLDKVRKQKESDPLNRSTSRLECWVQSTEYRCTYLPTYLLRQGQTNDQPPKAKSGMLSKKLNPSTHDTQFFLGNMFGTRVPKKRDLNVCMF
jgi:hypothetical protein